MDNQPKAAKGSIRRRFNLVLLLLYLLAVVIVTPAIYYVTERQVYGQAEKELSMLVDMVASIQGYVAKDLRPYFIEHDLFYSPGFSGIVATSLVAEQFKQRQPSFYIKNASDNPLNRNNLPNLLEEELLAEFRADRASTKLTRTGMIDGRSMLVSASAKISKPGCMRCHGSVASAPEQIVEQFGTESGYNYKLGDVVGVSLVGVPLGDVRTLAVQRSLIMIGLLTLLFAIAFVTIDLLVRRALLTPIVDIAETAHAVRQGDMERSIRIERNDEIGDLARSIELLRRSFVQAMKRLRK
jgi:HAMP domain-containing protein